MPAAAAPMAETAMAAVSGPRPRRRRPRLPTSSEMRPRPPTARRAASRRAGAASARRARAPQTKCEMRPALLLIDRDGVRRYKKECLE